MQRSRLLLVGLKLPDIELPKIKPPNSTADDITQAFQAISGGFQRSGFDKTIQDVLNNGFVEFSKAPSADAFRNMFDNWNEEFVNGKYRFTPSVDFDLSKDTDTLWQEHLAKLQQNVKIPIDDIEPPKIKASTVLDPINEIKQVMKDLGLNSTLNLKNILNTDEVFDFKTAISGLTNTELKDLYNTLDQVSAKIRDLGINEGIKTGTLDQLKEYMDTLQQKVQVSPMQFDDTELNNLNKLLKSTRDDTLSLDDIIKGNKLTFDASGGIAALENLDYEFDYLSGKSIEDLMVQLDSLQEKVKGMNLDPMKEGTVLDNLTRYRDLLKDLNVKQEETANVGSTKVTQFLDRYKYSLLLVGGALAGIVGMMRYSTTFGTALDILGQAIGYLADVIMYPLLPYVMMLAEWIIGLADWFNGLPDPIKAVVAALLGLVLVLKLIKAAFGLDIFSLFKKSFGKFLLWLAVKLAAWEAMMAAGGLSGALAWAAAIAAGLAIGLVVVYAMIQSGFTNLLANCGQEAKRISPAITGIFSTIFAPVGTLGAIIIDLLSGQIDQIPLHIRMVGEQGAEGFWIFVNSVEKALNTVQKAINDFLTGTGNVLKLNPLTAGIGDEFLKQANLNKDILQKSSDTIDEQIKKHQDRQMALTYAAQYGGFYGGKNNDEIWLPFGRSTDEKTGKVSAVPIQYTPGMEVPKDQSKFTITGSFLNGLTRDDQIAAYKEKIKSLEAVSGYGQDIDEIMETYGTPNSFAGTTNYTDTEKQLTNFKTSFAALNELYEEGVISQTDYQDQLKDLTTGLTAADTATNNFKKTSDMTDYNKKITDQQTAVSDLTKQYTDGTIALEEYQKKMGDVTKTISATTNATDGLENSTKSAMDSVDSGKNAVNDTATKPGSAAVKATDTGKNAVKAVSGGFKSGDEGTGTYTGHHFTVARDIADRQAKLLEAYAKKSKYQNDPYRQDAASRLSEVTAAQNALKSLEEQYRSSWENQTKTQTPAMSLSSYQDQVNEYYKQLTGKSTAKEVMKGPVRVSNEPIKDVMKTSGLNTGVEAMKAVEPGKQALETTTQVTNMDSNLSKPSTEQVLGGLGLTALIHKLFQTTVSAGSAALPDLTGKATLSKVGGAAGGMVFTKDMMMLDPNTLKRHPELTGTSLDPNRDLNKTPNDFEQFNQIMGSGINQITNGIKIPDVVSTISKIKDWWTQVTTGLDLTIPVNTSYNNSPTLPTSPAPAGGGNQTVVVQAPARQTDERPTTVNITINGYQKSPQQLADEIAKIWNTKSRGSRI